MKALVTGSSGFISGHLVREMEGNGYDVVKCGFKEAPGIVLMDVMDLERIRRVIENYQPDVIINLAGQADVGLSWRQPQRTFQLNTVGAVNIFEAVRIVNPKIKLIVIGSSDEYGALRERGTNVTEETPLNPMNPYAVSKQAQELFAQLYVRNYGLNVCMVRQFNLGGAGQRKGFLISDFASGIAEIEAGKRDFLLVGNLESARDFTHVKDACRAIRLLAEKGRAGEVYNICSGKTHSAQEVLDTLTQMAKVTVRVKRDPGRMRPSDTPVICGNHDKLTAHTGWMPERGLSEILTDALEYWRGQN